VRNILCKENPLLHFRDKTEQFHIAESYVHAYQNKKWKYWCVFMPSMITRKGHNLTFYLQFLSLLCH